MLITELKNTDLIKSQLKGKVFVLVCHGCKEIHFPEHEADAALRRCHVHHLGIQRLRRSHGTGRLSQYGLCGTYRCNTSV